MDFSQFLNLNPDLPKNIREIKTDAKSQPKQEKEPVKDSSSKNTDKNLDNKKLYDKLNNKKLYDKKVKLIKPINLQPKQECLEQETYKKGQFVIINRMEESNLNVYKGYYGEIKEITKQGEFALITLEAMNYPRPIKFPFGHFKLRKTLTL